MELCFSVRILENVHVFLHFGIILRYIYMVSWNVNEVRWHDVLRFFEVILLRGEIWSIMPLMLVPYSRVLEYNTHVTPPPKYIWKTALFSTSLLCSTTQEENLNNREHAFFAVSISGGPRVLILDHFWYNSEAAFMVYDSGTAYIYALPMRRNLNNGEDDLFLLFKSQGGAPPGHPPPWTLACRPISNI